jgi:hypothetical protein
VECVEMSNGKECVKTSTALSYSLSVRLKSLGINIRHLSGQTGNERVASELESDTLNCSVNLLDEMRYWGRTFPSSELRTVAPES